VIGRVSGTHFFPRFIEIGGVLGVGRQAGYQNQAGSQYIGCQSVKGCQKVCHMSKFSKYFKKKVMADGYFLFCNG